MSAPVVEVGTVLPELKLEGSPTFIISTAIATRDYQDVHHDRDLAQAKGSKDIFVNILTDTGLVQRFLTDWAGPTALATRDFQDVHHDRDKAQAKGSKDIFVNILTDTGLVERFVTDWAGPSALIKSINLRLGVPWYAYDTVTFSGEVTAVEDGLITVKVVGANSLGNHVIATATLTIGDA